MENASKALIMAGSILISIIIISLLVLGYNQMSQLEQTRQDAEEADKLSEYMRRFEQFNREVVYGSELLSLGNLQQDYAAFVARIDEGYEPVEVTVEITKEIPDSRGYFETGTYTIQKLSEQQDKIEAEIAKYEDYNEAKVENKLYNNRTVKYYSQKSYREIAMDFGYEGKNQIPSDVADYYIVEYVREHQNQSGTHGSAFLRCVEDISDYVDLRSIYNDFRTGKRFKCIYVKNSDANGRLIQMTFREI